MRKSENSHPAVKPSAAAGRPPRAAGREPLAVALILAIHAALAIWGAAMNSVTFDENYHVPDGVVIVTRGNFDISPVNPPLVKALFGVAALAAGARPPDLTRPDQVHVGESFMRINVAHYHSIFFGARLVIVVFSVMLGLLVWRFARRLYGARGALIALGFYALSPEALAHAGVATLDVATALGFLASTYGFWNFTRTGRRKWWIVTALALAFTALTRFTAPLLFPIFMLVALVLATTGQLRRPSRVWLGLLLLVPCTLAALAIGYGGQVSFHPLATLAFQSDRFIALQHAVPWLRLPLPDIWLAGIDRQSGAGVPTFLMGKIRSAHLWYYFPIALLFKWPLAFLGAIALRAGMAALTPRSGRRLRNELFLLAPPLCLLLVCMFAAALNVGIRYLFPLVPFACVWLGGLATWRAEASTRLGLNGHAVLRAAPYALVLLLAIETAGTAPWYLTFYNWPSGGPGGGYRLVNDSNVDWGQGLIALRREMERRHIHHIYLSYHGSTDPANYGIDYTPYVGGEIGDDSEWLGISSYYFVGLTQRMMTPSGPTRAINFDFRELWGRAPDATAAKCIYLFRLR